MIILSFPGGIDNHFEVLLKSTKNKSISEIHPDIDNDNDNDNKSKRVKSQTRDTL